jgi:hypothetical protein
MKLLTEVNDRLEYVTEESDGKKSLFIEGVFMQSELKNRNGRLYPAAILEREVNRYVAESVNDNRAYGELGHPQGPTINLDRVSHMIKSLRREGNDFIGKAKIMDTPMGNIVRNLIGEGARMGVSSRALGSLKEVNGVKIVQEDLHLATPADIVADPSAPAAFVRGIMENANWVYDASKEVWIQEALEDTKKSLKNMTMNDIEKNQIRIMESFLKSL